MTQDDEKFLQRLLATFKVEAEEHLSTMSSLLLELEKAGPEAARRGVVETLFREAHSLKGAARSVNLVDIEAVCKALESLLAALKRGDIGVSEALCESAHGAVDGLRRLLAIAAGVPATATAAPPAVVIDLIRGLEALLRADPPAPEAPASPGPATPAAPPAIGEAPAAETVRISTAKLGTLLLQAEELLALKFGAGHLVGELRGLADALTAWKKGWGKLAQEARAIRRTRERQRGGRREIGGDKAQASIERVLDAIDNDELTVKAIEQRVARLASIAQQERRAAATMVDQLLDDMKKALMLPFASLEDFLHKLVRDLAKGTGKDVEFRIEGANIEIDRRILEQMKDPLIHLVRNAIDHGIEPPAARQLAGKPARGRITLTVAAKDGGKIEVLVADDGRGVDLAQVRTSARKLGLLPSPAEGEQGADTPLLLGLMFESGLSTAPIVTDLSGRGLGLAIVREKVERLGGGIDIESTASAGTRFRITLPTTLATFRGLLVGIGERRFVLPSSHVERVLRVAKDTVRTVENRETIVHGGQTLALARLADVLGIPGGAADAHPFLPVAILGAGARRIAFVVDAILGDEEVLVKNLGPQLRRVRNVSAATVLGAGHVVPILNVPDLLKSAVRTAARGVAVAAPAAPEGRRQSLLVVEDSITSRSLLKNILEAAGFAVTTAVDGVDALTTLRTGEFDLVVSDVEMPRMDGFELTARLRREKDPARAGLPVVLVTALESREDRERGIDAGANAYIVKSSFDQGNLLEVIRRLI